MGIMRLRPEQVQGTTKDYKDFGEQLRAMGEAWQDTIIPTNGQTVFTVSRGYTLGKNALKVFINGVLQPASAYVENDVNTVTLSEPLYDTDVLVFRIEGVGSGTTFVGDHGHVYRETPTGAIDGVNKTYVIQSALTYSLMEGTEQIFLNGILQAPTDDYTLDVANSSFAFTEAPTVGDKISVNYAYKTYA